MKNLFKGSWLSVQFVITIFVFVMFDKSFAKLIYFYYSLAYFIVKFILYDEIPLINLFIITFFPKRLILVLVFFSLFAQFFEVLLL